MVGAVAGWEEGTVPSATTAVLKRIRWSADAVRDVEQHVAYIADFNPPAADRILRALLAAANSLITFPNRGRPGSEAGTRELVIHPPYVIVYETVKDTVVILRIWHGAQDRG
ncbi:MAG: type II toxin-antitoxin system RelE/ParE family toxin [Azospirillaceae bacterium]|nr:type II toxin-antitoxin system RelE/ParE family toxin [Azospirillaceae bacterium]